MSVEKQGRRTYFIFPYNEMLKDELKALGCKWDKDQRGWWAASNHKNIDKMKAAYAEHVGWVEQDVEVFEFEKDSAAIYKLKELGAAWDASRHAWIAPKDSKHLDAMRQVVAESIARSEAKAKELAEESAEVKRRKADVGPVHHQGVVPNDVVTWMKEQGALFVGGKWYMPTMELKQEAESRIWKVMDAKREAKEAEWADCVKFYQWTEYKNQCDYRVGQIVDIRDIDKLPGLVAGDRCEVVRVDRYFTQDGMSFGAPAGMDDAWHHTIYLRKI